MTCKLAAGGLVFCLLAMAPAGCAWADDLPLRKAGLWEVKMTVENRNAPGQTIQQCIDAATDQMMQSSAGPFAQAPNVRDATTVGTG